MKEQRRVDKKRLQKFEGRSHRRRGVARTQEKTYLTSRTGWTLVATNTSMDHFPLVNGDRDGYKVARAGCYFCDEPHKSGDCFHRAESAAASVLSTLKRSGFVGGARGGLGTAFFETVGTGLALTTNATTQRPGHRCGNKFWGDDSGGTENILFYTARTQDTFYGKAREGCAYGEATPSRAVGGAAEYCFFYPAGTEDVLR